MLSVGNGRSRDRSRSRERSRTRDSPPARAPPSRKKQAYDSDSEAISDDDDDPRYVRRAPDDRYDDRRELDRRKSAYEDERHKRDYEEDHQRRASSYAKPTKYEYARPETSRHSSYGRGKDDDYAPPGAFKDEEPEEIRPRGGDRYSISSPTESKMRLDSISSKGGMYAQPAKYEYAKPPSDVKYKSKSDATYSAAPAERGSRYATKSSAEIEVERRRHRRDQDEDSLIKKYEKEAREKMYEDELKNKKEAEMIRRYERELAEEAEKDKRRKSKYKDESSEEEKDKRRKSKYKDESSSEEETKYRRRKHSDEDREYSRKEEIVTKKYQETIEPKERRPSNIRHGSSSSQAVEIRPRENSSISLKPVESGVRRLSVSAGSGALTLMAPGSQSRHGSMSGGLPPGSPLLEAYRGTYQSISPMPSPMALPSHMDDGLSDLDPLDELDDPHVIKPKGVSIKKHVEIYDPEHDAKTLGHELEKKRPTATALIKVLPSLSHDNILALRNEYKKHFKSQGKGINVSKHIKVKMTGNIGQIAYATALGRWESEAYWANCWYQAGSSRRELLIESLLGRSNKEIRKIKEEFKDKRYSDSLVKCMETELKKDKFRHAVLLALQEKRMDEIQPVLQTKVREDVDTLYKALTAREGGETAMIDIIVIRSDNHLREVLRVFETKYKTNFARQMIQKSQNLVGETLAHILNGVLNRPVRDALLLHQALADHSKDRAELLMSRLIRYHWEPKHLEKIKVEYRTRYKVRLEDDIREGFSKGEFGDFCIALCHGANR